MGKPRAPVLHLLQYCTMLESRKHTHRQGCKTSGSLLNTVKTRTKPHVTLKPIILQLIFIKERLDPECSSTETGSSQEGRPDSEMKTDVPLIDKCFFKQNQHNSS